MLFLQSGLFDSGYGTLKRKYNVLASGKENSPNKKARKALVHSWPASNDMNSMNYMNNQPLTLLPETPVSSHC